MLSDNLYLGRCQIAMLCSVELNHKEKEEVDDLYRRVETLLGKKSGTRQSRALVCRIPCAFLFG